ncbi:MAG: oxidoreductase [Rhizobiales bacterium 65-9]|nr:Gfo/Idh/MocA family oxidoreductase [Hyphomicrobiales bacterium]OJY35022.1 MAG: oxidoreductase [Rhizobiales bacterium 65-9]
MSRRLKVAIVGLGIGGQHAEAYAKLPDLFEIAAVCDLDDARLEEAARRFGAPHRLKDYAELLRLDGLDIVDICTPPHAHFGLIASALAAGKHVVCEKPLVGSLADVDRLAVLERESSGRIMPIFQYRFGNGLQRLKYLSDRGLVGTPYLTTIETAWFRGADYYATQWRGKWATEMGGVCLTQAIHSHDMLSYINGPIRRLFARVATRVNKIEVEDCAAVSVEMENGSLATLSATLGSATQISRLRFAFSDVTAESNLDPYRPSRDPWTFVSIWPDKQALIDVALKDFKPQREFFEGQFERMHEALTKGGDLPVTLADARASLELITAIYHSARTGEAVDFPIGPDHPLYRGWLPADHCKA